MDESKESSWVISYKKYEPNEQGLRETLTAVGNGFFTTRGAFSCVQNNEIHYPGTYLSGGYNRLQTQIARRCIENEDLVNLPNWIPLTFCVRGEKQFSIDSVTILEFTQSLHLYEGVLRFVIRFQDKRGRESLIEEERFIHMGDAHMGAISWSFTPINWDGEIEIFSTLDGTVSNQGVDRYKNLSAKHLEPVFEGVQQGVSFLQMRFSHSRLEIAFAERAALFDGEKKRSFTSETISPGFVQRFVSCNVKMGQTISVEKIVSLYTSKDFAISECGTESRRHVRQAPGYAEIVRAHKLSWSHLWDRYFIKLAVQKQQALFTPQQVVRLHIFQLLQSISPLSVGLDSGAPARGWHGEAYRGHIFWDEIYILPFLLYKMPNAVKALLRYRFRRIDQARKSAKEAGLRGALFPWQSGSSGREETQTLHLNPESGRWLEDHTYLQRHVNLAIAYNVWTYFEVTADVEFMMEQGAELLLEIARLFASLTTYSEQKQKYEILHVMGPDEFHDAFPGCKEYGLSNNAYTNVMTAWLMQKACKILQILPRWRAKELQELLDISEKEFVQWEKIGKHLYIPYHDGDIISQFEGYGELKEFEWERYRRKYGNISRLDRILEAENDHANYYKVSKQADVSMLFYLFDFSELIKLFSSLGLTLSEEQIKKNFLYYRKRCSHGSTLSRLVDSYVGVKLRLDSVWEEYMRTLYSDVEDIQGGTTREGIHLGVMAGSVDIVERSYSGLSVHKDRLHFEPNLPEEVESIMFRIYFRGHLIEVFLSCEKMDFSLLEQGVYPIRLQVNGKKFTLSEKKRERTIHL